MKIAIVMAGGHVHGRVMAGRLAEFDPLVINEVGTGRAERFSRWLAPEYGPPVPPDAVEVGGHGEIADLIRDCDYAINGGAGIVKPDLLAAPRVGWLNTHPGLVPEYRGSTPVQWAVRDLAPVGATLMLMDEGIDTGPILIRREMPWAYPRSIKHLRIQVMEFCADLTAEFLLDPESYPPMPQDPDGGAYFTAYHDDDPAEAERRLVRELRNYPLPSIKRASGRSA